MEALGGWRTEVRSMLFVNASAGVAINREVLHAPAKIDAVTRVGGARQGKSKANPRRITQSRSAKVGANSPNVWMLKKPYSNSRQAPRQIRPRGTRRSSR